MREYRKHIMVKFLIQLQMNLLYTAQRAPKYDTINADILGTMACYLRNH